MAARLPFAVGNIVFESQLVRALVRVLCHRADVAELLSLVSLLDCLWLELHDSAALPSGRVSKLLVLLRRLLRLCLRWLLQGPEATYRGCRPECGHTCGLPEHRGLRRRRRPEHSGGRGLLWLSEDALLLLLWLGGAEQSTTCMLRSIWALVGNGHCNKQP